MMAGCTLWNTTIPGSSKGDILSCRRPKLEALWTVKVSELVRKLSSKM
jgi:hypothetical protein